MRARADALLWKSLSSGHHVAQRLAASLARTASLFPLDDAAIQELSEDHKERLDAFLFRFSSLAAIVQDHIGRAMLLAEEEDLSSASRKDQRLLLEKLGALDAALGFGTVAELRNRLSHAYPDDPGKQAAVMNLAAAKAVDLIVGFNGLLAYAAKFGAGTKLGPIVFPAATPPKTLAPNGVLRGTRVS